MLLNPSQDTLRERGERWHKLDGENNSFQITVRSYEARGDASIEEPSEMNSAIVEIR